MKVYAFANVKGGVGKTTMAVNFACISAINENKTILLDSDPAKNSMMFRAERHDALPPFYAFHTPSNTIHKDINGLSADHVFIDVGATDSAVARSALIASDYVIVPITPSYFDIKTSADTFEIIEAAKEVNPKLYPMLLYNQMLPGKRIPADVVELVNELSSKYTFAKVKNRIHGRRAYVLSLGSGTSVVEGTGELFKKAAEEMAAVYSEIINHGT